MVYFTIVEIFKTVLIDQKRFTILTNRISIEQSAYTVEVLQGTSSGEESCDK
jgi:hypothetical protein